MQETLNTEAALQSLQRFAVTDLSNWYLDVIKDRLYVSAADSFDRRASQTVLHALLQVLRDSRHLCNQDLRLLCAKRG